MHTKYLKVMIDKRMNNNEDWIPFIVNYDDQRDRERGNSRNAHFPSVIHLKWFPKVMFLHFLNLCESNKFHNWIFKYFLYTATSLNSLSCTVILIITFFFSSLLNLFHFTMNLPLNKLLLHKFSAWLLWCKPDKIRLCWTQFYLACVNNAHPFQMENHFISLWSDFSSSHTQLLHRVHSLKQGADNKLEGESTPGRPSRSCVMGQNLCALSDLRSRCSILCLYWCCYGDVNGVIYGRHKVK